MAQVGQLHQQLRAASGKQRQLLEQQEASFAQRLEVQRSLLHASEMELAIRTQEVAELREECGEGTTHGPPGPGDRLSQLAVALSEQQALAEERSMALESIRGFLVSLEALAAEAEGAVNGVGEVGSQNSSACGVQFPVDMCGATSMEQLHTRLQKLLARLTHQEVEIQQLRRAASEDAAGPTASVGVESASGLMHMFASGGKTCSRCQRLAAEREELEASNEAILAELNAAAGKLAAAEYQLQRYVEVKERNRALRSELASAKIQLQALAGTQEPAVSTSQGSTSATSGANSTVIGGQENQSTRMTMLQEQLAAATGDSAVIAERCDALQQQLQARAPRCSVVTCDVTIDARLSRWRWQSWRT